MLTIDRGANTAGGSQEPAAGRGRITLRELEDCLAVAAYIVVRHGDAYVPTFERLEREVEAERQKIGNRDRAQQVLASLMRREVKDASAL